MGAQAKDSNEIDSRNRFTGFVTRASCTPCDRNAHRYCVEDKLRTEGFITGPKSHCYCNWNSHEGPDEGR